MNNTEFMDALRARFTDPPLPPSLEPALVTNTLRAAPPARPFNLRIRGIAASIAILVIAGTALLIGLPQYNLSKNADFTEDALYADTSGGAPTETAPLNPSTDQSAESLIMPQTPIAIAAEMKENETFAVWNWIIGIAAVLAALAALTAGFWYFIRRGKNRQNSADKV